ncbi:MAG: hypothetical protein ACK5G7_06135 [Erysipelotrichaceae bacterium]
MKKHDGFLLVEALFSIIIASFLVLIISVIIQAFTILEFDDSVVQNRLGVIQLRDYLNKALLFEVDDFELTYYIGWDCYTLSLVNGRLIQQPGTLIFLVDIDEVSFYYDDYIYLEYCSSDNCIVVPIAYEPF